MLGVDVRVGGDVPGPWVDALTDLAVPAAAGGAHFAVTDLGDDTGVLEHDGRRVVAPWDELLDALVVDVRRRAVEGGRLVLHGGLVARGDAVLLLAGPSGSGKSSTVVELVRRGWRYGGDELVGVDPDGRLLPCPTPPRLTTADRARLGLPATAAKAFAPLRAAAPGAEALLASPGRATAVVHLRPGAAGALHATSGARTLADLAASAFPVADEAEALGVLAGVCGAAAGLRCEAASAPAAADLLDGLG